ncbi:membrane protein insertion efficiency factor YidD [Runella salmonicolor]|uniref:Membrane protein insertion efficiency factor YidD n=1 Tax=Runella salmonicolor TaxID=2950278 RepID=A0ABT1FI67_9BACT|nr:membrane protein insertion efficiency factor YidD [Runella salmonicolor]MCP1381414.1 membrane protein insertion efficiency factor YidD [Runella salmonicolor]
MKTLIPGKWVILLLIALSIQGMAQVSDLDLLAESGSAPTVKFGQAKKAKQKAFLRFNPVYWMLNGALTGYQKVISPQISAECLYELSCSRFSRAAIQEFGIFKGIALSADRISRCNRVAATSIELIRISPQTGRVIDMPSMYRQNIKTSK